MARGSSGAKPVRRGKVRSLPEPYAEGEARVGEPSSSVFGWATCECVFSIVLVGLLCALPFNVGAGYFAQTRESFVMRAEELFSDGAFEKAAALYQRAVDADETPDGHVFLAETLVRIERIGEAIAHYERAALLYDDEREKIAALASVGRLHTDSGAVEFAVSTYEEVLRLQPSLASPDIADAHMQLAAHLLGTGTSAAVRSALVHLEEATSIAPALAAGHLLLADGYRDLSMPDLAVRAFKNVVKYRPRDVTGLAALATSHLELGHFKLATNAYRKALAVSPNSADVRYALSALSGDAITPARAPPQYVEELFDLVARRQALRRPTTPWTPAGLSDAPAELPKEASIAVRAATPVDEDAEFVSSSGDLPMFDQIHGLVYNGSIATAVLASVRAAFGLAVEESAEGSWLDVLELGCGDGSAGAALRSLANRFSCVDLSAGALAAAARAGFYDELERGELVATCRAILPESLDLVVAVDSVPYLGDLMDLLSAVFAALRPGGVFVFNVDALTDQRESRHSNSPNVITDPFKLRFTGRWQHRERYIQAITEANDFLVRSSTSVSGYTNLVWHTSQKRVQYQKTPIQTNTVVYTLIKRS